MRVSIHDPAYFPSIDGDSFVVEPGVEAYVSIEKLVMKTLNKPYSDLPCQTTVTENENRFLQLSGYPLYSYGSCRFDCLYQHSVQPCNCEFFLGNRTCSLLQYVNCSYSKIMDFYKQYNSSSCACLKLCEEVQYDYQLSVLTYSTPSTSWSWDLQNWTYDSAEYLRENVISLHLYFDQLEYEIMEQIPAKSGGEIIADIGGQMGLFLGASLMTLCEIIEFLCLIVKAKVTCAPRTTKVEKFKYED